MYRRMFVKHFVVPKALGEDRPALEPVVQAKWRKAARDVGVRVKDPDISIHVPVLNMTDPESGGAVDRDTHVVVVVEGLLDQEEG